MKKLIMVVMFLLMSFSLSMATEIEVRHIGIYWDVEYQGVQVKYHEESCGSLSKNVLLNVAHNAEAGVFEWSKMENNTFRSKTLRAECKRLRQEMINRSLTDTILNRGVK